MATNLNIGVNFSGNLGNLPQQAAAAAAGLNQVGSAANAASSSLTGLGNASEHAFDEIAAGAAAMARIEAAIEAAAAAARDAAQFLGQIGSSAVQAITPLSTLESRLQDIRDAIGRAGTVQGAANLAAQYDIVNRTLQETRDRISQASAAAIGLGRAFNTVASASASLNRLAPAIRPALDNLRLLPPATNSAAASLARIRPSAGNASVALTDFSRIVQDAPFGFVAIGNNITQLVTSFGDLRRNAGSTGAAFRQLFTGATGFGGIGLALSAITTAVTFASIGFGSWTRGLGSNKQAVDDAKKATEEFVNSLKTVESIAGQATGGVQGQIAQVQALASVVTNTNASYEQRKRALQELQQINKSYFGDLKLEESQMGTLTARVNEYTKALVQQAVVKGFESEISKVSTGLFEQEKALKAAEDGYKRLRSQLEKTRQTETSATGEERISQRYVDIKNATHEARKAFEAQRDVVEQGRSKFVELQGALSKAVVKSLEFRDITASSAESGKGEVDALKQRIDALKELRDSIGLTTQQQRELVRLEVQLLQRDGIKLGFTPQEIQDRIENLIQSTRFGAEAGGIIIRVPLLIQPDARIDVAGAVLPADIIPEGAFDGVVEAIRQNASSKLAQLGADLQQNMADTIANSIVNGLTQAADVLGSALGDIFSGNVGEGITAAAEGFLGIVGGVLQEVGKQIIIVSNLVNFLKDALNKIFGPGGEAISAGVGFALIALGGVLKNIKIPAFAEGTRNFGGGVALVGERGPEVLRLPGGSDVIPNHLLGTGGQPQELYSVIRGQDIYMTNNRARARRARI